MKERKAKVIVCVDEDVSKYVNGNGHADKERHTESDDEHGHDWHEQHVDTDM